MTGLVRATGGELAPHPAGACDQAEMVMLRVVAGLDVAQVATIVGRLPGTVRVTVHRALKKLAQELRDQQAHQQEEVG